MKLTERQAQAIVNLLDDANFKVYLDMLGQYGEDTMQKLVFAPKEHLDTIQGKAQAIAEIMKSLESARETLKHYKTRGHENTQL